MAKYKTVSYGQMQMIPLSLTDQLEKGSFEHTVHYLIEEKADLSCVDVNYKNDETGATAIPPAVLLKIILYGYSKGILSSRRMEEEYRNNIIFKTLSCNLVPDHSTISAFISGMKDQIRDIYMFVLMVCSQSDLIGGNMFAVDGCKIPSNAAKEWSGTFKELRRKKEKFARMAEILLEKHKQADKAGKEEESVRLEQRAERIRKKAEKIEDFLKNQNPRAGKRTECRDCKLRKKCVSSDQTRYRVLGRPIHKENRNYSDEMRKYIDTPQGRDLYSKRMGIVEPVFSNMTYCKGMDRFMFRGKEKCNIKRLLYCIVHNIGKIQVYGSA